MREHLRRRLGGDDLVAGERGADEEDVEQGASDPGGYVQTGDAEAAGESVRRARGVEAQGISGQPGQRGNQAEQQIDPSFARRVGDQRQRPARDGRAKRVEADDAPSDVPAVQHAAPAVRHNLHRPVRHHCRGNRQRQRQRPHQHKPARHPEHAGNGGGDEDDCEENYVQHRRRTHPLPARGGGRGWGEATIFGGWSARLLARTIPDAGRGRRAERVLCSPTRRGRCLTPPPAPSPRGEGSVKRRAPLCTSQTYTNTRASSGDVGERRGGERPGSREAAHAS